MSAVVTDVTGVPTQPVLMHSKIVGKVLHSLGGVGRNMAEGLFRLGISTMLLSVVASDTYGQAVLDAHQKIGMVSILHHFLFVLRCLKGECISVTLMFVPRILVASKCAQMAMHGRQHLWAF